MWFILNVVMDNVRFCFFFLCDGKIKCKRLINVLTLVSYLCLIYLFFCLGRWRDYRERASLIVDHHRLLNHRQFSRLSMYVPLAHEFPSSFSHVMNNRRNVLAIVYQLPRSKRIRHSERWANTLPSVMEMLECWVSHCIFLWMAHSGSIRVAVCLCVWINSPRECVLCPNLVSSPFSVYLHKFHHWLRHSDGRFLLKSRLLVAFAENLCPKPISPERIHQYTAYQLKFFR